MNLTIGKRITLGFATVLTIVVFLGVYGYHSSVVSDSGFTSYREMALDNTLIGRAQANILMMRLGALGFFNTDSKNSADQFWKRNENVEKFIKKAQVEIQNPERSKLVDSVDEKLIAYKTKFKEIIGLFESRDILVNGEHGVNTLGPQMEKKFSEIMTSAFSDNDPAGSYYTAETLKSLLITRLRVLKYLDDNSEDTEGQVRHYLKEFKQKVRVMKKEIQNSRRKALLQEGIKINNLYATSFDKIAKLVTKRNQLIAEMATLGSSIAKDIEDVKLSIKEEQDKIGPKMANNLHRTKIMTIVVSSIATLIGIILAFLIIRSITRVLSKITINLSDASTQVASASKQLSNASQEISSGAVEQASSIEETSSSLEEITGMVAINVDNSEETVKLSNSMMEQFKIGNESIELVQGSMNDILKSNERIEDLVKVIADIGKKTEIMDEIVFQTKLLSFNASVEAERAGEHGRGFAVVAQEVGNLAQMSGKAAQEISDIVKESTDNAQAITAENKNKVEQGNGFVVDTTNVLKEMMSSAKSVLEASHQVLTASKDQSSGIQQISAAMNQLDKATQENAATAEETASTSEQLNAQSSSMLNVVKDLTKLVSGIKKDRTKTSLSPIDTNPSKSLRNIKTANNVESDCSSLTINKASGENWKNL